MRGLNSLDCPDPEIAFYQICQTGVVWVVGGKGSKVKEEVYEELPSKFRTIANVRQTCAKRHRHTEIAASAMSV